MADSLNSIIANRRHERHRSSFEALSAIQATKRRIKLELAMALIKAMAASEYKLRISF